MSLSQKSSRRAFGIVLGGILLVGSYLPLVRGQAPLLWMTLLGAGVLLMGVFLPRFLEPFYQVWRCVLNRLVRSCKELMLRIFFYGILRPLGLRYQWVWKRQHHWKPKEETYWRPKSGRGLTFAKTENTNS